ncbi:MAG: ArsB/NhaD family transporter [Gammaproteobacteria bacterium]|jgi:Na+/H+ antiporter NhaD/arsenite permease-like protein|nr:ArsB/NhaD family transporter [Gammaproteobacteria bacterium]MBT3721811.1 ArsB/NhaD family transporter [Gammaproteobacteria bacterium]MBT4077554.1 ArsB/NhaD family transporter [Gammaproteobacteria bacterium]MBT4195819.1 ArsB/NhaD family transporter [Gammaproteobacteria bacterium]MBT4450065.1 ArsB/NhaD family transporter [Gammaproteobacteria bacterium]
MLDVHQADVIFGLSPVWFAGTLFVITYVLIVTERLNRAIISMMAAALMIMSGVLTQQAAVKGVDFNTIGLLTGMMIIVGITRDSGVFQYLAIRSAKMVKADPWGILVMLMMVTAVLSALLDNVTTVLLIAPVTLLITDTLKLSAYPYLFAEIFAANIGGTATLIGDPPNIMIGSATGLGYNDFLFNLAPISIFILFVSIIPIYVIWGRKLKADPKLIQKVMLYREIDAIHDWVLLKKSLFVLTLVMIGFIVGHDYGLQPATAAMFGAALLLTLNCLPHGQEKQTELVTKSLNDIEWITIFFFIGLFILVYGVESTGILEALAHQVLGLTGGDKTVTAISILFVSAVASTIVDNIPFVATMIPLIKNMAVSFGGAAQLEPIWWSLALGSCLGGNGSLVGASANLIVAGFAERSGQPIHFLPFMLIAFPMMMVSVMISSLYVYLRYF